MSETISQWLEEEKKVISVLESDLLELEKSPISQEIKEKYPYFIWDRLHLVPWRLNELKKYIQEMLENHQSNIRIFESERKRLPEHYCKPWFDALLPGSDNEGYANLVNMNEKITIGYAMECNFCPYCGFKVRIENA